MLHQYETVFIMTPVLSEDQMLDTVNKFKKILTDNGTEIVHENNWGLRKLAYPIQKRIQGFTISSSTGHKESLSISLNWSSNAMSGSCAF